MIIRSQNKTKILNFENLRTIKIEDLEFAEKGKKIIRGYGSASFANLGEYSTEEKAIKVLDMIQIAYEEANSVCNMSGFVANTVFQMPKDEEA